MIEKERDKYGSPLEKRVNDYMSSKYVLKSKYTLIKYQMNLSQIDQIKDVKSFEEYLDVMQISYQCLIDFHLDNLQEKIDQGIGTFFKNKFAVKEG